MWIASPLHWAFAWNVRTGKADPAKKSSSWFCSHLLDLNSYIILESSRTSQKRFCNVKNWDFIQERGLAARTTCASSATVISTAKAFASLMLHFAWSPVRFAWSYPSRGCTLRALKLMFWESPGKPEAFKHTIFGACSGLFFLGIWPTSLVRWNFSFAYCWGVGFLGYRSEERMEFHQFESVLRRRFIAPLRTSPCVTLEERGLNHPWNPMEEPFGSWLLVIL